MSAVQNKAFNFSISDEQWPPPFLLRSDCLKDHHDRIAEVGTVGSTLVAVVLLESLRYSSRVTDPSVGGSETRLPSSQTWTYGCGKGLDLGLRVLPNTKASSFSWPLRACFLICKTGIQVSIR